MAESVLALFPGLLVGLALGLTGSGGSLLAIPLLVYVLGFSMADAVPLSLLVVGSTALLGALAAWRSGVMLFRPTAVFAAAGMLATPFGLALGQLAEERWRSAAFAVLAIGLSLLFIRQSLRAGAGSVVRASLEPAAAPGGCRFAPDGALHMTPSCIAALAGSGLLTGLMAGIFGVGGGFIIVPALTFIARLDMPHAVGSSLAVIALVGMTGGALQGIPMVTANNAALVFIAGSFLGVLLGRMVAVKVAGAALQRGFAITLLVAGLFMLLDSLKQAVIT